MFYRIEKTDFVERRNISIERMNILKNPWIDKTTNTELYFHVTIAC